MKYHIELQRLEKNGIRKQYHLKAESTKYLTELIKDIINVSNNKWDYMLITKE